MIEIGNIKLPRPFFALAPMEDVSDPPFRILCKEQGADVVYTEFVSVEGIIRNIEGSVKKLDLFKEERPVAVQIFGAEKRSMIEAVKIIEKFQPDFIDINYGCPVKKIVSKGCGAGILLQPEKMFELTKAVVEATELPVTVKTRLGWDENNINIVENALRLQDAGIKALAIHGRTRKQMYKGTANWEWIKKVKEHPDIEIPIIGNGDIDSPKKAHEFFNKYNTDGLMIGRAAIGNPWIFKQIKHFFKTGEILPPPTITERVKTTLRHLKMSVEWKGEKTALLEMRKHYANYFKGLPGIKPYRIRLVKADSVAEIEDVLNEILENFSLLV